MQRRCAQRSNGMSHGARCLCWARAPSPVAALRDSVLRLPTDILSLLSITPHPPPAYLPSVTRYRQSIKPPPPPPPPSPTSVPPRTRPFKATAHFIRQAGRRALRHTFAQPRPKRERESERKIVIRNKSTDSAGAAGGHSAAAQRRLRTQMQPVSTRVSPTHSPQLRISQTPASRAPSPLPAPHPRHAPYLPRQLPLVCTRFATPARHGHACRTIRNTFQQPPSCRPAPTRNLP